MKSPFDLGMNRTGIATAPRLGRQMKECSDLTPFTPPGGITPESLRLQYTMESPAVGTVPIPTTLTGLATSAGELIRGRHPTVLLNKLGERLAFERTGTRLYEQILLKARAEENTPRELIDVLIRNHEQEKAHFTLLTLVMQEIGADPTAMVPCADVTGVLAMGLIQALGDPRVRLAQGLEAILIAELTDEDAWRTLIEVGGAFGLKNIDRFERAWEEEEKHLIDIHEWHQRFLYEEAGLGGSERRRAVG